MPTYQATPLSGEPAATRAEGAAAQDAVDPTGQKPHGYYRDHFFGGTLAPIAKDVEWSGHRNTVRLRILEADEARQCARYAFVRSEGHPTGDDYLLAATICRIAFALEGVDDLDVASECKTFEQRLQLAAELSESLQEAIIAAYDEARYEPIRFLSEMAEAGAPFVETATGPGSSPVATPSRPAV